MKSLLRLIGMFNSKKIKPKVNLLFVLDWKNDKNSKNGNILLQNSLQQACHKLEKSFEHLVKRYSSIS